MQILQAVELRVKAWKDHRMLLGESASVLAGASSSSRSYRVDGS